MFLKVVDCEGKVKDGPFIADILIEAIEQVGARNVVQVITDNAKNCRAVGLLVESRYPHIFWTPCAVHSLNLMLQKIGNQIEWIKTVYEEVEDIQMFVTNHHMTQSLFRNYPKLELLKLLNDFPKDLASLKRAQVLCFYIGRPDLSLQLVEQVLPEIQDENYVYGMLSFPLLEVGRMGDAETAARKGLAINSDDPWSQHALCHVFQHECRFNDAVHFMEECADSWNACCSFMYTHNWWHLALCYLEGHAHLSKILDIYDSHIWAALQQENVNSPQVYLNALGLLLRIHVRGNSTDIHDRMRDLVVCLMDQSSWYQEWLLDLLATWAFAYANTFSQADQLLEGMKRRVNAMQGKRRESMQRVLLLAEALYQYGKSDYTQAYDTLGPNFNILEYKVIGASDEQLDVFEEVWCVILINTGHISEAIQALERRAETRSGVPFTWRLLEKAHSRTEGDALGIITEKAKSLETAYFGTEK